MRRKLNWVQKVSQEYGLTPNEDRMNNMSDQAMSLIPVQFPDDLREEIRFHLEEWKETEYAQEEIETTTPFLLLYQTVLDIENFEIQNPPANKKWIKAMRLWFIELGVYRAYTKDQLRDVQVLHGKKYEFKMNGLYYQFENHPPGYM